MAMPTFKTTLLATALSLTAAAQANDLNLQLDSVTVSGLSSGGYMANQFHIAYSDWVKGAAIMAAGPYYCGQSNIGTALSQCVSKMDPPIDLAALNKQAEAWAKAGKIASLDNLKDAKVWLLHGTLDSKVAAPVSDSLYEQYSAWTDKSNITYIDDKPFSHLFPTVNKGTVCTVSEAPFIGNCDYDAAGELLTALEGELAPPSGALSGKLVEFDQHKLGGEGAKTLADTGYAYVPASCASGEACKVHISFHGCNQYAGAVGTAYAEQTGLNQWADSNHIVVVYPQTQKSLFSPLNPQGCWDWWGYTGPDYATKDGAQISAVRTMVEQLATIEDVQ